MTIETMRRRKRELGYTYAMIAKKSGVPLGTVQKVLTGATRQPRYETLRRLEELLGDPSQNNTEAQGQTDLRQGDTRYEFKPPVNMPIRETQAAYATIPEDWAGKKRQGEYTLEDFYAMPEDWRGELIDGVLYDLAAPSRRHQTVIGALFQKMFSHMTEGKHPCQVYLSPMDVQLDCDDRTMVEPDLLVICRPEDQFAEHGMKGAPDFVLEVLSPSTKSRDLIIKLNKYMEAQVREYWIVEPEEETITVYDFEHEKYPIHYTFADTVPVLISGGELSIDFQEVKNLFERWGI